MYVAFKPEVGISGIWRSRSRKFLLCGKLIPEFSRFKRSIPGFPRLGNPIPELPKLGNLEFGNSCIMPVPAVPDFWNQSPECRKFRIIFCLSGGSSATLILSCSVHFLQDVFLKSSSDMHYQGFDEKQEKEKWRLMPLRFETPECGSTLFNSLDTNYQVSQYICTDLTRIARQ